MNNERTTIILAFIAIYIIWGSTYVFNKILLTEMPPFQLAGFRFVAAGLIILVIAILRGTDLRMDFSKFKNALFAGFLFLTVGNGAVVYGLKYIDSGFAALLISSQPLILLFMLWLIKGQKIQLKSYIGVALGITGIFLLTYDQGLGGNISWKGIALIYVALFSWGYGSIFVGSASLPKNQFVSSAYQMLFAGILLIVGSLIIGEEWTAIGDWSSKAIFSMSFLVLLGSIIAFTSFNYLLKKVSPEKVATSTYINPIVAMFLGWIILNERISLISIVAALVLLAGVYFINSVKSNKTSH